MTNLMRWDPFREMQALRETVDRLFESSLSNWAAEPRTMGWTLALDVAESENEYVVTASVPGIKPEDLDITFTDNTLTIKGELKVDEEREDVRYHLRERRYGQFTRSIALPTTIDAEHIEAEYENGVLTLHLPKAEEARPKRINVRTTSGQKVIEGQSREAVMHQN
ncbi:MAG: Hsp20/alpha crystallin family protein [Anaerolineae bacterium]|nr:MAG: Hsp20/alpha crystallin family protein [Anaerolineae bacterium]